MIEFLYNFFILTNRIFLLFGNSVLSTNLMICINLKEYQMHFSIKKILVNSILLPQAEMTLSFQLS